MTVGALVLIQIYIVWSLLAWLKVYKYKFDINGRDGMDVLVAFHWLVYVISGLILIGHLIYFTVTSDWWNYKLF